MSLVKTAAAVVKVLAQEMAPVPRDSTYQHTLAGTLCLVVAEIMRSDPGFWRVLMDHLESMEPHQMKREASK